MHIQPRTYFVTVNGETREAKALQAYDAARKAFPEMGKLYHVETVGTIFRYAARNAEKTPVTCVKGERI